MRVYRVQTYGTSWGTEWFGTQAEADEAYRKIRSAGLEVRLDRVEVSTDKPGLVAALNAAGHHRMNWPGEEVRR